LSQYSDKATGLPFPAGAGIFSLRYHVQTGSGADPSSYPLGSGACSLGIKRQGLEADHPPPSGLEVKHQFIPARLHGVVLSLSVHLQCLISTWEPGCTKFGCGFGNKIADMTAGRQR
jgi:hypothetical protein